MTKLAAALLLAAVARAEPEPRPVVHSLVKAEVLTCKTVADRQCKDAASLFTPADGSVTCWSRIVGQTGGVVHHVWYKGKDRLDSRELKVSGSPWRVWSKKTLYPDSKGDWRVEILDGAGVLIQTVAFKVQ